MTEMNSARFERIRELFLAVRDLSAAERARVLGESCGGDAALRAEVEELIAAHDEDRESNHIIDQSPMGASIARMVSDTFEAGGAEDHPSTIGAYAIVKLIGEGGMGRVYEARQSSPSRSVAVKVLKSLIPSKDALRRFEREAEMLAKLQHPGIAQVYEFGSFSPNPDSRRQLQYFAMEFVKGDNLSRYVRDHELGTEAKLQLLAAICDAVEHAHLRGIIHRDLKPGNILIEEADPPRPKILDFGVARSLEHNEVMKSMQTEVGQIVGTLAYMSPEQVAGDIERINARTDVYSLGVILYELLTGRLPHNISVTSIAEAARAIQHDDPAKPGTINNTLRGDLETIVLKAIERDPARRYQSASALAQDIRNFLADRPIDARPPTRTYLFTKFARRNTGLVAGATAAILALVAGLTASLILYSQAAKAQIIAEQKSTLATKAQNRAEGINRFLMEDILHAFSEDDDARNVKLMDAIFSASEKVHERFGKDIETQSVVQAIVGTMLDHFSEYEKAERMLRESSENLTKLLGPNDKETLDVRYSLGKVLISMARHEEAETLFRDLITRYSEVYEPHNLRTIEAKVLLGQTIQALNKTQEADKIFEEVIPVLRSGGAPSRGTLMVALQSYGTSLIVQKHVKEAEEVFKEAIAVAESEKRPLSPPLIIGTYNLSKIYFATKRVDEAAAMVDRIMPSALRAFGPDSYEIAAFYMHRGKIYFEMGKSDEAEQIMEKGYEITERLLGKSRYETEQANNALKALYKRLKKVDKLEVTLKRGIELRDNVQANPEHDSVMAVREDYASFLLEQGRAAEAKEIMEKVLPLALRVLPPDNPVRARVIATAARCGMSQ